MQIFVAVGTQKFQFNRILILLEALACQSEYDVFAQRGYSDYIPKNYNSVDFLSKIEFENKIDRCDLFITHAGVSSIITAMMKKKKIIVIPRLSRYGEHVDDHQLEIAKSFSEQGFVLLYEDGHSDIRECIRQSDQKHPKVYESRRNNVINIIRKYINEN